ncbi:hypothetical protein [Microbispora rosea]|uniref:hypothetical protein n=1 Tax=Microbispora rosea TaxID=58117 RepID=UPI0037AFE75D
MSTPYGPPNGAQQPMQHPAQPYAPQQGPGYGPPPPGPYGPPAGYGYPPPMAGPEPRNGLGLAALICALLALPCALVPILFLVGGPLSIVALCLGIAGQSRVSKGRATNRGACAAAILIGVLALLGAINGARITFTAVDNFNKTVQEIGNDNQQMIDCVNKAQTAEEIAACAN